MFLFAPLCITTLCYWHKDNKVVHTFLTGLFTSIDLLELCFQYTFITILELLAMDSLKVILDISTFFSGLAGVVAIWVVVFDKWRRRRPFKISNVRIVNTFDSNKSSFLAFQLTNKSPDHITLEGVRVCSSKKYFVDVPEGTTRVQSLSAYPRSKVFTIPHDNYPVKIPSRCSELLAFAANNHECLENVKKQVNAVEISTSHGVFTYDLPKSIPTTDSVSLTTYEFSRDSDSWLRHKLDTVRGYYHIVTSQK